MADSWVTDLRARAKKGFERRDQMKALYQGAMKLGSPGRNGWEATGGQSVTPGKEVQKLVYDSTLQSSCVRLANALFMGMTPPTSTWMEMVAGSQVPAEMAPDVKSKLEQPTNIASQLLWECSFYSQWLSFLMDFIYGTAVILVDEAGEFETAPACFQTLPLHEIGIEEDHRGQVSAVFREHSVLPRNFPRMFEGVELPEQLRQFVTNAPDNPVSFTSCFTPLERKYVQTILYKGADAPIQIRNFNENPVTVARTGVLSGEVFGRGPALNASATAHSLNDLARLILVAAEMGVFGMFTVADDSVNPNKVRWKPGGMIKVRSNSNVNPTMRPLESSARLDWAKFVSDEEKSQIQKMLFRDALGNVDGPHMTAREVSERQQLVMQDMGTLGTSLNDSGIGPTMTRYISVLSRRGPLPPGLKVDGRIVALRYVSPFVRAQAMEEVGAMRGLMGDAQAAAQTDPGAGVWIDTREYLRKIADKTGVPLNLIRDQQQGQQNLNQIALAKQTMAGAPPGVADQSVAGMGALQ